MNNLVMNGTYEAEGWKPIPHYEEYLCSNLGNIKRLKGISSPTEHLITPRLRKDGFYYVSLWKDGNSESFVVHRLVGILFVPNHKKLPIIIFSDDNKLNCRWDNLKWGERYELKRKKDYDYMKGNKFQSSHKGEKNSQAKISQAQATEIKVLLAEGLTAPEIVKQVKGATNKIVWNIKCGKTWNDDSEPNSDLPE